MNGHFIILYVSRNDIRDGHLAPEIQNKLFRATFRVGCAWNLQSLKVHELRDSDTRACVRFQVFGDVAEIPGFEICTNFDNSLIV